MQLHDLLIAPFAEFAFMRRALAGAIALAIAGPPLGVFLILRRMALTGDAMAHAILPGAALGYLAAGLSLGPMTIGGLAAGAYRRGRLGRRCPHDGSARGCFARGILSDLARARRHHCLLARLEHRSFARALWQRAGA